MNVVAHHRPRHARSHQHEEDTLVSYLYARTKKAAARWAFLEELVVSTRYDAMGGDFYWDPRRSVEETTEFKALVRRSRRPFIWPAVKTEGGSWVQTRDTKHALKGQVISAKEARRRNRISLTRRRKRAARSRAEESIPEAPEMNVFYREFKPYPEYDLLAFEEAPPGYSETDADEETIERLHAEYEELERGGSPGGIPL